MFMFKSNGGNGTVHDVTLENFIGHKNAYSLYLNAYVCIIPVFMEQRQG